MNQNDMANVAGGQVPNAAETALGEFVTGHVLQQDYRVKFFDLKFRHVTALRLAPLFLALPMFCGIPAGYQGNPAGSLPRPDGVG